MSGESLYPVFFVRLKREGQPHSLRIVEDASVPAEGEDVIRAKVKSLSFEDKDEGADVLKLAVDNFDLSWSDNPWCKPGDLLKVKFGFPGNMSGQIEGVITKLKLAGSVLNIEANGKEYLLNKTVRPRTWDNVKRSDVVRAIAAEYGYSTNAEIVDTEVVFRRIVQAKLTDHQMIVELAKREGFVFYIDADGFYFGPRKLSEAPIRELTYYVDPDGISRGDLLVYPTIENDLFARPGAVTAKGRDPDKKKDFKATADNNNTPGRKTVASTVEVVDPRTGKTTKQTRTATDTTVATTAKTAADAKRQVAGIYATSQLGAVKLNGAVRPDPNLRAKKIVRLSGIGALFVGNYYIVSVTHSLSETSYACTIKTRRESKNTAGVNTPAASKGAANNKPAPQGSKASGDKLEPREVVDPKTGKTHTEYR